MCVKLHVNVSNHSKRLLHIYHKVVVLPKTRPFFGTVLRPWTTSGAFSSSFCSSNFHRTCRFNLSPSSPWAGITSQPVTRCFDSCINGVRLSVISRGKYGVHRGTVGLVFWLTDKRKVLEREDPPPQQSLMALTGCPKLVSPLTPTCLC